MGSVDTSFIGSHLETVGAESPGPFFTILHRKVLAKQGVEATYQILLSLGTAKDQNALEIYQDLGSADILFIAFLLIY